MKLRSASIVIGSMLALAFLGGAFLRFENLNKQSYWMDEGYTVNAVISGMQNGTDFTASILDSGFRYVCPLYCIPTQGIVHLLGDQPASFRILAAICGLLVVLLAFFLTRSLFKDTRIAIAATILTSLSYWQIAWSREARWYTMLELFFWGALYFFFVFLVTSSPTDNPSASPFIDNPSKSPLIPSQNLGTGRGDLNAFLRSTSLKRASPSLVREGRGGLSIKGDLNAFLRSFWEKKKQGFAYLVLAVLFAVAAMMSHALAYLLPIIFLLWYVILHRPGIKRITIATLGILSILAIVEFGFGRHFIQEEITTLSFHNNLYFYGTFYLRTYWPLLLFAGYGCIRAKKEERKMFLLLSIPFFLYLIPLSFLTDLIEYRYLFHTTLALLILSAFGIVKLLDDVAGGLRKTDCALRIKTGMPSVSQVAVGMVIFVSLIATRQIIVMPDSFYLLESDDPAKLHDRDYFAYTPQPNFSGAYGFIKEKMEPGDVIISSHPHFNKIFLNQSGYWLGYDYLRRPTGVPAYLQEQTEHYVGATVVHNADELQKITSERHGFIVFDLMATDGRIPQEEIDYIRSHFTIVYHHEVNNYSVIWVYRF